MLIPIFTIYANKLSYATPALIGIALGGYGLSQGLLQIPFGMLSDRWGRKKIITIGLLFFTIGSLLGAFTTSIYGMIAARILQGMGAIGGVLIALLSDLTPDRDRTKAMAVIGATIGISFSLAMIISPIVSQHFGLSGIFYLSIILAILGLVLLHGVIPTPEKQPFHVDSEANINLFKSVFKNLNLQRLNLSIFIQHLVLTSTFFVLPIILKKATQQGLLNQPWHFYLAIIFAAFVGMVPFIIFAEKRNKIKLVFLGAVLLTGLSQSLLIVSYTHWTSLCLLFFMYFLAFNVLEAIVPSLVSKHAGIKTKGTAMGVYSTSQFLGIFAGGVLSGFLYQHMGIEMIFAFNSVLTFIWLLFTLGLKPNAYEVTLIISSSTSNSGDSSIGLRQLKGVREVVYSKEEGIFYLRIDKNEYVEGSADALLHKTK
ncbi:transporter, major facilitator family [Legionella adelaidensis]|uniref:Transporter, major facilitator family n=2 Tax=Legionella adelaidensis TaxID=45056 RepID=A0A0W0R2B9_9GAMM|nr:transporter, major facilitator family [Legionella adelaidensis]